MDKDGTSACSPTRKADALSDGTSNTCVICQEEITNKCFADGCMHSYCYGCLLDWIKVTPKCPICRQAIQTVLHSVTPMGTYEEYAIKTHAHFSEHILLPAWLVYDSENEEYRIESDSENEQDASVSETEVGNDDTATGSPNSSSDDVAVDREDDEHVLSSQSSNLFSESGDDEVLDYVHIAVDGEDDVGGIDVFSSSQSSNELFEIGDGDDSQVFYSDIINDSDDFGIAENENESYEYSSMDNYSDE